VCGTYADFADQFRVGMLRAVPARSWQSVRIFPKTEVTMKKAQRAAHAGTRKMLTNVGSWMRNELGPFLIDIVLLVMTIDTIMRILRQTIQT